MKTRAAFFLLVFIWSLQGSSSAFGAVDSPGAAFDAANKLYEQGKYAEAASGYEKLLRAGTASAAVYFNLGNAFFKAGRIGEAITAYHQAERLTPRDPDLRANLQFARNRVQGLTYASPAWQRWLGILSLNEWSLLAAAVVWLFFSLLTVGQWRPSLKRSLRYYTPVLGTAVVVLGALLALAWSDDRLGRSAVVVRDEAVVRQGPLDESPTNFTLHDGAEVQVLDHKDDWLQITTGPHRIGWVKKDSVLLAPAI